MEQIPIENAAAADSAAATIHRSICFFKKTSELNNEGLILDHKLLICLIGNQLNWPVCHEEPSIVSKIILESIVVELVESVFSL